jgi:hypothetical protein
MSKIFGFETWISCIASCTLYHYATRDVSKPRHNDKYMVYSP